jgi:hypothetical protein
MHCQSKLYTEASSTLNDITALPRAKDPSVPVSKGAFVRPTNGMDASKTLQSPGSNVSLHRIFCTKCFRKSGKPRNPNVGIAELLTEICNRNLSI